jgi:hypothetical protein
VALGLTIWHPPMGRFRISPAVNEGAMLNLQKHVLDYGRRESTRCPPITPSLAQIALALDTQLSDRNLRAGFTMSTEAIVCGVLPCGWSKRTAEKKQEPELLLV